jgi:hypothetical protein
MRRSLWATCLAFVFWTLIAGSAAAQGGIAVESSRASSEFPDGVVFTISLQSDAEITDVRFRYTIPPEGANVYGEPECNSGTYVQCTFNLKSNPKLFLVPGAVIIHYWQIEDAAGNKLETEPVTFVYEDDRFDWESMSEGKLTIWHYSGSESEARTLLQTGLEGLQRIEELLDTEVEFPVKVFFYASAEDMRPAVLSSYSIPEGSIITLGEVFFSDTAMVSADVVPFDILRHELAHIVVRQAVKGPFGQVPAWLDEGTAVYAQSEPLLGEESALDMAIRSNDVLSLRSMTSGSLARSDTNVSLFYGQSWSIVSFLIETYGSEDFALLFATLKEGNTIDNALLEVYGFDRDGLENAWRESVGLPPREFEEDEEETLTPPELTPLSLDGEQDGEAEQPRPEAEEDDEFPIVAVIVVVALTVALAGSLAVGGVILARRWR